MKKPQMKGVCKKVYTMSPKKPNSAVRKVAIINIAQKGKQDKQVIAYIPGIGNSILEHNKVLMRGGKKKDLPGIRYIIIRGALDVKGDASKRKARSKYGAKKIKDTKK